MACFFVTILLAVTQRERAFAAEALGFPKQTDGRRMVKAWRASQRP